eukprot:TRINITY_DN17497_c0_g1_i1.p1 TRINITY_DN17497_c0_g1~~TRINITY_DN17497_c0_g1_i1.p1  ORF type:complete len:389 (-),score=100.49 TRINITY_DN17497_c0_g1_i1:1374-2540(-)
MSDEKGDDQLEPLLSEFADCISFLRKSVEEAGDLEAFQGDDLEITLLRYAKGFQGDQEAAWTSLKQAVDIRKEFRSWEVPDSDSEEELIKNTPHLALVLKYYPSKFFHQSRESGVPVTFRLIGRANADALVKQLPLEDWRESAAKRIIAHFRKLNKISRERGRLITQDSVLDLHGITQYHMSYMAYFQAETTIAQTLAPETMKSILTVNAPWFFNILWKITSNFINERSLAKSSVVGTNAAEILSKMTAQLGGQEFVPALYGGQCQCGECLVLPNPYEGMTREDVSAGATKTLEVVALKDDVIEWSWKILAKDISCTVDFLPDGSEDAEIIQESAKLSPVENALDGHFVATQNGTFRLIFDNSSSYWYSKSVYYKITIAKAIAATLDK